MLELLAALLMAFVSPDDVEGLRQTAPAYLTTTTAREHLAAARIAAVFTSTDPALLLSIAWHESRYTQNQISPEAGGLKSCGVMTPEPVRACHPGSLVVNYLDGARHLRGWMNVHGSIWAALLGYAGGFRLINHCFKGGKSYGCKIPWVFKSRADKIRRSWQVSS